MKYKVGDKVRVRKDIILGRSYGNWAFIDDMTPLIGQHVTITKVLGDSYEIEEETCRITDEMLETMDDWHKPALDGIGFQDSLNGERAWWTDYVTADPGLKRTSAGKTVAWINYMTNVS